MTYRIHHAFEPDLLCVRIEGEESFKEALRFWEDLHVLAGERGISRFLVVDRVVGRLSTVEHYDVSELVARLFQDRQIAYVDPKEETFENNSFGETVVMNRGVKVKLFRTEEDARAWLQGEVRG